MNFRKFAVPVGVAVLTVVAFQSSGWSGVALVAGGVVMWLLLHFNRTMQVLKRANERPIGYVDSAVMLNAKLRPGVNLLHVVAMTRSLGVQVSPQDQQPELFRWTDNSASHVTCEFADGRLARWTLFRPLAADDGTEAAAAQPAAQAPVDH